MDDASITSRTQPPQKLALRPTSAYPSSNWEKLSIRTVDTYMADFGAPSPPMGMLRPSTAHPTGEFSPQGLHPCHTQAWRGVADLLMHKGYASVNHKLPQLGGSLHKGSAFLKDPNSPESTSALPSLKVAATTQRVKLEGNVQQAAHVQQLESEVRILQAQLDNQPQAFDDLRRQLEESEGKRRQLEAGYDALRKSGRATKTAELESDVEVLKAEVLRLMKLLKYAQYIGSDPDALAAEIVAQERAKVAEEMAELKERAKRAERVARASEKRLAEALERERALQAQVKELLDREPAVVQDPGLEDRLRAEYDARLRDELAAAEARLSGEIETRLRCEMEDQVRPVIEAQVHAELDAVLRPLVEGELREAMRGEVEASLRAEMEGALREELEGRLRVEIEAALRPEIEAQLRGELETRLQAEWDERWKAHLEYMQGAGRGGMANAEQMRAALEELEGRLAERDAQLQEAVAHAQASFKALTGYLRTKELPESHELSDMQLALQYDVDLSAERAAAAVPSLKVAHRVVMSQVAGVRDMLVRYTSLTQMPGDLEDMFGEAAQHPDTAGMPDVLKQLLALLAALAQDMRGLPGLPGSLAVAAISATGAEGPDGDGRPLPVSVVGAVSGVQDVLVILQVQLDMLRRRQPQGTLVSLHAEAFRQLALLGQLVAQEVTLIYGADANQATHPSSSTTAFAFVARSDAAWLRLPAEDAARMLESLGHRLAGWLLRNGLAELAAPLCGGVGRAAWLSELRALDSGPEGGSGGGGLARHLAEGRPEPASAMAVSRLQVLLREAEEEAAAAAAAAAGGGDASAAEMADEEAAALEGGGKADGVRDGGLPDSGPLPMREGGGEGAGGGWWAARLLGEDIHVALERYGLVRWAESLWQYGVRTVQQLLDATRDCPAEIQGLTAAMFELERSRLARLVRNAGRASACPPPVPATPEALTPERSEQRVAQQPRELTDAERLGLELLAAAARGDACACEELLVKRGARPELAVDPETGRTALMAAAEGGYVDVVALLLFHNADASVRDRAGRTALLVAARNLRAASCEALLQSGRLDVLSSLDVADDTGRTAVVYACRNCMKDVAVKLVLIGADASDIQPLADQGGFGQQIEVAVLDGAFLRQELFLGAEDGDVARCERAVNSLPCGPNVKPRDGGFTPLHAAVLHGREAAAAYLLKKGATPDAKYSRKTALVCAAVLGNGPMIRVLAAGGVDVKRTGYEALMEACQHRQAAAAMALLELGAPAMPAAQAPVAPGAQQGGARSLPLSVAAFNGMPDVVRGLLERSVPADAEVWSAPSTLSAAPAAGGGLGFTSLMFAASGAMYEAGTVAVAQLLLQRGADVNRAAADGSTALQFAANCHGRDMVRVLLAAGARPGDRGGRHGRSALMHAAARKADRGLAAVEALLQAAAASAGGAKEASALCTATDADSKSAYDHALASGSPGVARLLEEYSAKTAAVTGVVFRTYTGAVAGTSGTGSILKHQLRLAVGAGDVDEVRRILQQAGSAGWSPDEATDASGRTPLHLAVLSGADAGSRMDVVQMLLDAGCDANRMYDYDSCALRDAALRGDSEMVGLLLPRSGAATVRRLALHSAIYKRHQAVALELLSAEMAAGAAAMAMAAANGATPIRQPWGSLLHEAAEHGLEQVCTRLLDAGADAGELHHSPALRAVSSRGEGANALCVAAAALPPSAVDICLSLLDRSGVDAEWASEESGATALMHAAAAARHDGPRAAAVARLLLSRGALLGSKTKAGRTPLMWAAMQEGDAGLEVAHVLLDEAEARQGVKLDELLNAQDDAGDTAVMLAVGSRSEGVEKEIRARAEKAGVTLVVVEPKAA